jgi:hypothetical protein
MTGSELCRSHGQKIAGSEVRRMVPEKLSRQWLTLVVRLTVFPITPWEAPPDLWEKVVGEPPENDQNQPRQRLRVWTGPWHGGVLQLTISPHTIVWTAVPPPTEQGLPNLEGWAIETVLPKFVELTRPWLTSVDFQVNRIGFGLHSLLSAPDRVSAYGLLVDLIPSITIEPEETTDLLYQINRPVRSNVLNGDVKLNRLMKWYVPFFGAAPLQATGSEIAQIGPIVGRHFAGLDNDTNTPAEHRAPLDTGLLEAIYGELVELAWKNLQYGEKA